MDDYLPVALLHLREAEIVRLCGLARAARGQEYSRTGQVRQPERAAGTLRGTILEGEVVRTALAHFSDSGLEQWECSCTLTSADSPSDADLTPSVPEAHSPCEHVAALLYVWVRAPEAFHVSAEARRASSSPALHTSQAVEDAEGGVPPVFQPAGAGRSTNAHSPATPATEKAQRPVPDLAPPGASTEAGVTGRASPSNSLSTRGEGRGEASALPLQPLLPAAGSARAAPQDEEPEALPPEAGLYEMRATERLPALLLLVAALVVDRSAPAPDATPPVRADPSSRPAQHASVAERLQGHAPDAESGGRAPDPDAALLRRRAQQLDMPPEQMRFCLALLRLIGLLPAAPTARQVPPGTAEAAPPLFSHAQSSEALLQGWRVLLARHPMEVLRDLFTHWLHAHSARELLELRDAGVRVAWLNQREAMRAADIAAENQAARQLAVDLLRRVPVGRWWNFSSLVDAVWRLQPDFLRGHQQLFLRPRWWLERLPDRQPLAIERRADWRQGEGRYLALLVRRALHWLGAVDLALDAQGRLKGFRITSPGAFLLGAAPAAPETLPPPADALASALQPLDDGTLLVPLASLDEAALAMLLWWCEPAGATPAGLRFLPSAERVAGALDAGQPLEAWLSWLEQGQQHEAIYRTIEQIRRWAAMYGQVRLYESATLLEVADQALLPELEATLSLSTQFADHQLAPGLSVLRPEMVESLVGELRRRGYDPWIISHETPH